MAVLGLTNPVGDDWARLRSMQYASLAENMWLRVSVHMVTAALTAWLYLALVSPLAIGGWFAALLCGLFYASRSDKGLSDADTRNISRLEFQRQNISVLILGAIWCVPLIIFSSYGTIKELLILWTVALALIVSTALMRASAPLGSIIFNLVTGSGAIAAAALMGEFTAAVCMGFVLLIIILGTIECGRTYLVARIAEAGMEEKNEVVSMLLREFEENQADWLWQVDTGRRIRSASPRFSFALGQKPADVEGKPFLQMIAGETWESGKFAPSLHELAEKLKARENFSNLIVRVSIDGQSRWWEISGTPILDEHQHFMGFRGVGSDVTEQRESSEKIAYLARYDTLTSLPNRMMLNEALRDAIAYAKKWRTRCAFLMLDLDRFKSINDSLGHMVGDELLAEVSSRLNELMDDNTTCGRLGGDEFAIVIRDASEKGLVERLARRIIRSLSRPYNINNNTLYVGASVGSAIGPRDGKTVEEIMRNADLALYRAKDEGGGEHSPYESTLHANAEERRQLEVSLRSALENNELHLNYQPVVDANSEALVSFEALLRWNSKEHGFVRPDKFIALAEDTRLIVPIGAWVLREACQEATNWPGRVRVAVNVSGEQLIEPDFATTVVQALSRSGLEPSRLEIEVTESIFLRDPNIARAALEQVIALGCTVALDDFGTGYSSLGYLRKLSFSTIKVDRSFVQGAAQGSAESIAIIRAVVAMADSLKMATTAEGVENIEEAQMIREMGCSKIQGYYFGRPMSAEDAGQLCARTQKLRA
ncbi:putative bifunctional diguanylate cyclase/phosphodiesterase [Pontixanthobacter sp.]|uniref:putative bifunctional diguanylate cyclase/phosphodiesterase n=1 Tax=Pontixanthobacter sp. TaxID=2792078 RepID=UPI003C7ACE1E